MSKTFFIADTHFHHKNIMLYEQSRAEELAKYCIEYVQGYEDKSVQEVKDFIIDTLNKAENKELIETFLNLHDEMLIKNWNETVGKSDTVWFLGDFALLGREGIKRILSRLNGEKYLVIGNHDNYSKEFYRSAGFKEVVINVVLKDYFFLTHHPAEYIDDSSPFYNIFGHVHGNPKFATETAHSRCVSLERTNFRPIELEIFNKIQNRNDIKSEDKK